MIYLIFSQLKTKIRNDVPRRIRYKFAFKWLCWDIKNKFFFHYFKTFTFFLRKPILFLFSYFFTFFYLAFYFLHYFFGDLLFLAQIVVFEDITSPILILLFKIVYTNTLIFLSFTQFFFPYLFQTGIFIFLFLPSNIFNRHIDNKIKVRVYDYYKNSILNKLNINFLPIWFFFYYNLYTTFAILYSQYSIRKGEKYYYIKYDYYPWEVYPEPFAEEKPWVSKYKVGGLMFKLIKTYIQSFRWFFLC